MSTVKVRIAPSPTGSPHVGTAYMGLFNYAFARSRNGKFILRIEDTDQTRSRSEYETGIFNALHWIGLTWDEGPDVGGPNGPYRQSERTELYRTHARMLLDNGSAYHCFCTPQRLAEMRERMAAEKISGGYDGHCRNLPETEVREKLDRGDPFVIRMKVPESGECVVHDRLRGEIRYQLDGIDDQILLKSDRFPTYHLANVVDDHLMQITHVIRGEEWLPSTPKHILLYRAFGWDPPEFIHMPLLLNPDGSKLSKRKNPTAIDYYRDAGYLPEALLNYLGLMSYSRPNQEEKFTLEEFVSDFDIDRISLGGAVFDLKKLKWLTGRYIRENHLPDDLWNRYKQWRLNDGFLVRMLPMMMNRLQTLGDLIPACAFLLATDIEYETELLKPQNRSLEEIAPVLQTLAFQFETRSEWTAAGIERDVNETARFWNWPIRDVTRILFVAVMGREIGPPLFESMEILGSNMSRRRLMNALDAAGGLGRKKLKALEKRWIERGRGAEATAEEN
ncbi:glutamate--tRNA ligase [bacterium]|nr:glutamate--tRNA ligase [candidate division CSSED10-310 bacterium]